MTQLPTRPVGDPLTLRLDRWASVLRNYRNDDAMNGELTLTDDERHELSILLTEAGNAIS